MERLKAYTRPAPHGGVIVDIEGMSVDLVTACKAGHISRAEFQRNIMAIFDAVTVEVTIPDRAKN